MNNHPSTNRAGEEAGRGPWNGSAVEERITEAVETLARVPAPSMRRHLSSWPEFVADAHDAYGCNGFRPPRAPASAAAVTRLDETLAWLRWLPREAQKILWARASGLSWRKIAHFAGKAPNTCRAWYLAALHFIAGRLNAGAPPPGR